MTYALAAEHYDLLYADKDYATESMRIRRLVEERRPGARALLDVACGTGRHLEHLRTWYTVEGLDAETRLVEVARRRLPDVPLHVGDMRDFDFGREFDVVTCLFSAIGYMQTLDELGAAMANMARHLAPGGVLLVEPWLAPDQFTPGHIGGPLVGEASDVKVVRMNDSRVEGRLAVMNFYYLVGRAGRIEHFVETHTTALYTDEEYRAALDGAGLRVEHDEEGLTGRGLWIGTRGAPERDSAQ